MRPCYSFSNTNGEGGKPALLTIYEEIGFWGVQAKDFVSQLNSVQASEIEVEINSPGGDTFAGVTMYNALRASGKQVTTKVMGVAASAASLVFMAGDKRVMPANTMLMIHDPWTITAGNAAELRETADMLDKVGGSVRATYAARSGLDDAKLTEMLSKDTWLTADEAKEHGFATDVVEEVAVQAKFDLARAALPETVMALFKPKSQQQDDPPADDPPADDPPADDPPADDPPAAPFGEQVQTLAKTAGFESFAGQWALSCTTVDQINERIACAREVKSLCEAVGKADKANDFIKASKSVSDVRAALIEEQVKADEETHVDTTQSSSNQPTQSASQSAVKIADIYAKRAKRSR